MISLASPLLTNPHALLLDAELFPADTGSITITEEIREVKDFPTRRPWYRGIESISGELEFGGNSTFVGQNERYKKEHHDINMFKGKKGELLLVRSGKVQRRYIGVQLIETSTSTRFDFVADKEYTVDPVTGYRKILIDFFREEIELSKAEALNKRKESLRYCEGIISGLQMALEEVEGL